MKTKSGTHPNLIARAQAPGKPERDPERQRVREKVETNPGTQLNVIFREQEQVRQRGQETLEQTGTSSRPEIRATTCEPPGETRPKCTPAKEPEQELEVALLTGLVP